MSMMEYFSKKAKMVASFEKLEKLREEAHKMIGDFLKQQQEFVDYFDKQYPGIEPELKSVIAGQYAYHRATLENEYLRKKFPQLESQFDRIDEAFFIDRVVKTGSIEKYKDPKTYNEENAARKINSVTATIPAFASSPENKSLLSYLSGNILINTKAGKISLKQAVSSDLYDLVMDAVHRRSAIRIQLPYVNRAIDNYNLQYEYCYDLYNEETKQRKYRSIDRVSLDKFEENTCSLLIDQAFNPTTSKVRAQADLLESTKNHEPSTM